MTVRYSGQDQKSVLDRRVNYDEIAPIFDERYRIDGLEGVAGALMKLARSLRPDRVLEVGCGTGHWLALLQPLTRQAAGLDLSLGMLRQAGRRATLRLLTRGRAGDLPFRSSSFDLAYVVNALHHFSRPAAFVREAHRLLRPGGALAVVGMNPHGPMRWYLYDYFPGTLETDRQRFPSPGTVLDWMASSGFDRIQWQEVHRITQTFHGRQVLTNSFLKKASTSQLALLSDDDYAAGLARIHKALARDESLTFPVDIPMSLILGYVN